MNEPNEDPAASETDSESQDCYTRLLTVIEDLGPLLRAAVEETDEGRQNLWRRTINSLVGRELPDIVQEIAERDRAETEALCAEIWASVPTWSP